jgi:hypothetical protein
MEPFACCLTPCQEVRVPPCPHSRYQPDGDNGEACCGTGPQAVSIPQPRGWAILACHIPGTLQKLCRILCRTVPQFIVPDPSKSLTAVGIVASPVLASIVDHRVDRACLVWVSCNAGAGVRPGDNLKHEQRLVADSHERLMPKIGLQPDG